MASNELPVFFDQTGRRWRNIKRVIAVCGVAVITAAALLVPAATQPVIVGAEGTAASQKSMSAAELEREFNKQNVPVIGSGQFIRAVRIDRQDQQQPVVRDVFSGRFIRNLSSDELLGAGTGTYAIERYGQLPDRQIVLTFDDGPDPAWTPQLLDMLSEHGVRAAFFVVGANVVKHPELARRIVREGHTIANHTFSHVDFEFVGNQKGEQEITQTQRAIRAVTGYQTAFMRVPYTGSTDESQRDNIRGILLAQQFGYVETGYDYDTHDWQFTANQSPDPGMFDGSGRMVLLHDAGGNRSYTLDYVRQLLPMAQAAGYTFASLDDVYPGEPQQTQVTPSLGDKTALAAAQTALVWPVKLMWGLFAFSVTLTLVITGANIALAYAGRRRTRKQPPDAPDSYQPGVTVLVPAYNEEKVLAGSVRSLLASRYKHLDVIIIDDGSRDKTLNVANSLAAKYSRVSVVHQPNRGKSAALNNGLGRAKGEIIISIDADTMFEPETVGQLVRHFYDPRVGAVAGTVRVGNIRNMLTRWQALEYITSIAIERAAQATLGAITVVPGACGAWRKQALLAVGGFSDRTLAEDCDVALAIHEAGFTIVQDVSATGHTECPMSLGDLAKQRFRWIFGNIQSYWKHRAIFFNLRYGWLGMFVLPTAALTMILPMIFWPLLIGITVSNVLAGRWWPLLLFPLAIMAVQAVVAFIGLRFARESLWHLSAVPLTRLVYSPLRTYILYRSLLTVSRGALVGWNKFKRTNTVMRAVRGKG